MHSGLTGREPQEFRGQSLAPPQTETIRRAGAASRSRLIRPDRRPSVPPASHRWRRRQSGRTGRSTPNAVVNPIFRPSSVGVAQALATETGWRAKPVSSRIASGLTSSFSK